MLCGTPPFNGKNESEIFKKITRGVFGFSSKEWVGVSKEAKDLIKKMLTKDSNARISAEEAWNDPWVQSYADVNRKKHPLDQTAMQNLVNFRTSSKLQQATLAFIASNLASSHEIEELRSAFTVLDINGDGQINEEELRIGFSTLSLSASSNVEQILTRCDLDGNGMIDYNEFIMAALDWQKHLSNELLQAAFKAYDTDNSGSISILEIKEFLGCAGGEIDSEWKQIFDDADANGDGCIDLDEFKAMMLSKINNKI